MLSLCGLFLLLVSGCVLGIFNCPGNGNVLPNVQYMGYGFDTLYGQPAMNSLRKPVIDHFCSGSRSLTLSGVRYIIPDLMDVISQPATDKQSNVQVYTSVEDVQSELGVSLAGQLGSWWTPGMLRLSAQAQFFENSFTNKKSYTAFSDLRVTTWRVVLPVRKNTTVEFQEALRYLPPNYDSSSCSYYKKFIQYFGTHYVNQALFGGAVSMDTSFASSLLQSKSESQVITDVQAQFFFLSSSDTLSSSDKQRLDQLNAQYSSSIHLVGGDTSHYEPTQWQQWSKTVSDNPILLQFELKPLSSLLPANDTRRAALDQAVAEYLRDSRTTNSWTAVRSMPTARKGLAAAAVDGVIYAMGGILRIVDYSKPGVYLSTVEAYNPNANTWTTVRSMPTARYSLAAATVDGIIFAIGGNNDSDFLSTVEAYNPSSNTWTTVRSMPTSRYSLASAAVDGIIYAIGGKNGDDSLSTVEAYNPSTNTWTTVRSMPTARDGLAAAVVDGIIYAIGGYKPGVGYLSTVEAYNPSTNSWTTVRSMPTARGILAAAAVDGIIYAIGGYGNGGFLSTVEAYNPSTNTWTIVRSMPTARYSLAAAVVDVIIYAIGGYYGNGLSTVEAYNPPRLC